MKKVEVEAPTRKTTLVRGKYVNLLRQGTNVAILDPDVVEHFPDSESVNSALRAYLELSKHFESVLAPRRRPPKRTARPEDDAQFDPRTGTVVKVLAAK